MIEHRKIRSTTILGVRSKGKVAVAGDGQVTLGDMAMKQKAVKVRKFDSQRVERLEDFLAQLPMH